ncbi:reverse transcriptase zinc-binding domain-containing protein [Tanacetum coccineum]
MENDSWGWRNILRMRQDARMHMVMKIRDGSKTSLWFDSWSSLGALIEIVSFRDLYDARMESTLTLKVFYQKYYGQWPEEWRSLFPMITQSPSVTLIPDKCDELVWKRNDGVLGKFSVSTAYYDLQCNQDNVTWKDLVWFSQNIPKHAFILWLAIQGNLTTQDKIRNWGTYDMLACPLCLADMDSHSHLFFNCNYSRNFWHMVKRQIDVKSNGSEWGDIVNGFAKIKDGNSIGSVVRRLCLAASVYLLWQERNHRLFKNERRNVDDLF